MAENSKIEWTDHIDDAATGRQLGAYKTAAARTGCSLEEWKAKRRAGLRWCFRCRAWKSGVQFAIDNSRLGGRASCCKPCASDASTASRYGMTAIQLAEFRREHNEECQICSATDNLYIDHDHETDEVRGLLCPSCNSAIGLFKDNPNLLRAAIAYLERNRG